MHDDIHTRLVFGTAGFDLAKPWYSHLRLLSHAWECGIRCFDTAPIYAHGQSEQILGRFLKSREATIHTKCGLTGHRLPRVPALAFRFLRFINALRPKSTGHDHGISGNSKTFVADQAYVLPQHLTPSELEVSFKRSLKSLKVDSVGSLLLHEVPLCHANHPEIQALFGGLAEKGFIREGGVAGHSATVGPAQLLQDPYRVFQTEGYIGAEANFCNLAREQRGIAYSVLKPLAKLQRSLQEKGVLSVWRNRLDSELQGSESIACWLVAAALGMPNVSQIVFFSSCEDHITQIAVGAGRILAQVDRLECFKSLYTSASK